MAHFPSLASYPHIGQIINIDLPKIINDHSKFKVFKQFGGFSDKEARNALREDGPIPIISIEEIATNWGHYPGSGNEIYLSKTIADQYETIHREWSQTPEFSARVTGILSAGDKVKNTRWRFTVATARLHIESTILHEMVHWGDHTAQGDDGKGILRRSKDHLAHKRRWSDLGHLFVRRAYKKQIGVSKFRVKRGPYRGLYFKQNDLGIPGWLGWNENKVAF